MASKILHNPSKCKICWASFLLMKLGENLSSEWRYLMQKAPRLLLKLAFFYRIQNFIKELAKLIENLDKGVKTATCSSFMSECVNFIFYKNWLISTKFKSVILQTHTRFWRIDRVVIVQICAFSYLINIWTKKKENFLLDFLLSRTVALVKD